MAYPKSSHDEDDLDFTWGSSPTDGGPGSRSGAQKPPPRRKRPAHTPGTSLSVIGPAIKEVMDTETGEHHLVAKVIGTDYSELIKLRMVVRTALHKDRPLYRCSICGVPVYLCRTLSEQRFFFKHRHEDGNCPAVTRGELNHKELNALKYNGAKESALHRKMKEWVVECLTADGRFVEIREEARWVGAWSGEWRRPDVRATYNGIPIAFEVQLSTTFIDVIAERRSFYLEQGGLLFWIFAVFDSEHRRMTEEDVFYNNNQNIFIVDAASRRASIANNEFVLECVWAEPTRDGGTSAFHRKKVSFHDLTLEPSSQRAYYFDFDGRRQQLRDEVAADKIRLQEAAAAQDQQLRDDFEVWWGGNRYEERNGKQPWAEFRNQLCQRGIKLPVRLSELDLALVTALYSAKNNTPWGQRKKKLVEVAHSIAGAHKEHFVWFMHAVRKYGRLESMRTEGDPKKWAVKYALCKSEYKTDPGPFLPSPDHQDLIEFLFPELCPLP